MKKKLIMIISCLLAAVFGLGMFSGCDLLLTDNRADMEQVVAEVNIGSDTDSLNAMFSTIFGSDYELDADVESNLSDIVTTDNIYKRDLVAYFINYGYSYVSQGSYTYAEAFELMMDSLVSRKIMVQYAMLYYLSEGQIVVDRDSLSPDVLAIVDDAPDGSNEYGYKVVTGTDGIIVKDGLTVSDYLSAKNQEGLSGDAQTIAMLEYFLTADEINYAQYQLRLAVNSAIDSYEQEIIAAEEDSSSSTSGDRATPTGANETDENYYPQDDNGELYYEIYTGSNFDADLGEYEKLDGSSPITRRKAYNSFINSLAQSYLKDDSENPSDFYALNYYYVELKTQYEQVLINKFADTLALNMSAQREEADLQRRYNLLRDTQEGTASTGTSSDFTTTMDSMSDTSFVLYSPTEGYGFVYNILLPFSQKQTRELDRLESILSTAEYYAQRNKLLVEITGEDQRSSWFNGAEDYSFDAKEGGMDYYDSAVFTGDNDNSSYLFFKDSYTQGNGIDRYTGKYPYNGKVTPEDDGTYTLVPNEVSIDQFLAEMDGYLAYVNKNLSLTDSDGGAYSNGVTSGFAEKTAADFRNGTDFNYDSAIYFKGKINGLDNVTPSSLLKRGTASYDAISAFNELMFAYSTDTGCLNTYLGYSIAAEGYSTTYVAEFEYAAQTAIKEGAGTLYVVGTDYGWHIIYVSMALPAGDVYEGGFVYGDRNTEGTFSYYFYQALKDEVSSTYTTDVQNRIIELLNNDSNVTVYTKRYSDLASIGA